MKNNLMRLNNATSAALEVLEELAELATKLEHLQGLALEVASSKDLPVEAREDLGQIAQDCGMLIARGKE